MKKEILKLTGLTEDQFYKMYPTEAAFKAAYPNFKLGGTPEAFPQIATADNFFSYGVPVPPTIHAYGGPVYPQIQTEAQFFSPVYSNSNNAYYRGGSVNNGLKKSKYQPGGTTLNERENEAANKVYGKMISGISTDGYDEFLHAYDKEFRAPYLNSVANAKAMAEGADTFTYANAVSDPGSYANWVNSQLGRQAIIPLQKPFEGPYDLTGRTPNWRNLPDQMDISEPYVDSGIDYRTLTPSSKKDYLSGGPEIMGRGGSYMEAYPQAKRYPQGPVGGSAFYMMQDGGSSMQEPTKDQTFYTQKMNDFFDKLRQASYKNLMNGIMNTEDQSSDGMKQLTMGRHGGLVSYQGNTTPSQTTQTNTGTATTTTQPAATTTTTTQQPNFQMVTGPNGQSYLVGPNNQLYAPYTGNQTTTTSTQQQAINYYPYMNRNGYYVGTGLDSVANWLIPNNPRERYRNIREQKGKGITDLTEEQIKAIQKGTANIAEISYDTRSALFPRNRLKSVNIKFRTPGQNATATQTQAPMLMPGQKGYDPTVTNQNTTTTNQQQTTTQPGATAANPTATTTTSPATTTTTSPAASTTNKAATSTQSTTPAASAAAPASAASSSSKSTTDDVNAKVAQMQKEAREKEFAETTELEMPAEDRMKMQEEQNAVDAQFKNYENYKKYRDMMIRQGKTPEEFDFNRNYEYSSVNAPTTTRKSQPPSNTNSMDDAATRQKKAGYIDPSKYVNQAYIDAQRAASQSSGPVIPSWQDTEIPDELEMPASERMRMEDERRAIEEQFRQYQESLNFDNPANYPSYKLSPYRLGGPYALPMYQGLTKSSTTGTTKTGFQAPWQRTLDLIDEDNYKLNAEGKSEYVGPDEFEVGLDVGRTKKQGVNPYLPAMIRGAADFISGNQEDANADAYTGRMMLAENVFKTEGPYKGTGAMNTPAGADITPDQMVPVGYTGAGYRGFSPGISYSQYGGPMMFDVADLFFLTPQMLKNTRRG